MTQLSVIPGKRTYSKTHANMYIYVGFAQARPNKVRDDSGE